MWGESVIYNGFFHCCLLPSFYSTSFYLLKFEYTISYLTFLSFNDLSERILLPQACTGRKPNGRWDMNFVLV
ncbi:hypothetical protein CN617_26650 [Bacillus wiedmannii]|nr:hypothetical protein CN617_26650 [Bacillus wiedmannii]